MAVVNMKPVQVYLRPAQIEALRALASRRGVSIAELIREGVDQVLANEPVENDPLWDIIGIGDSAYTDLSANHDAYLAKFIGEESHREG